jgi:hypothetical protein
MRRDRSVFSYLLQHFFRRFFDNDTLQAEGDTQTSVVRALAIVAVPGLMFAFWLQNAYPRRTMWGAIEDQYFFVVFSFVVMGIVAIFEWEMLFPDRLDFVILSPLSVRSLQMLGAKAAALGGFVGLFLVGSNVCGTLTLPAVTTHVATVNGHLRVVSDFWRQAAAHALAVSMAGLFAALLFVALGGVMLCVLSARQFRVISPLVQTVSVMGLVLLLVGYLQYGDAMQKLLSGRLGWLRLNPTLWFLAVYEQRLHGAAAPEFAQQLSGYAYRALAITAAIAVATYPLAWARMRKMAIEGGATGKSEPLRWIANVIHRIVRQPGERAVFHFIGQTIRRNNQYQVYLAMYCGTGLAFSAACAVTFHPTGAAGWGLSDKGLHAVMPLLVFWGVAGLRAAFAFPLNLQAAWVYRVTRVTAAALNESTEAASRWALICAFGVTACVAAALAGLGWDARKLLVQAVCGVCLAVLLTDAFFLFLQRIPFAQPRMPGKTSLPLMLTLYVGVLPIFLFEMVRVEMTLERDLVTLVFVACGVVVTHLAVLRLSRRSAESEEEMEGYEGEFQLLNLAER